MTIKHHFSFYANVGDLFFFYVVTLYYEINTIYLDLCILKLQANHQQTLPGSCQILNYVWTGSM